MGRTIAEKIISEHAGREVRPDELVVVNVDAVMATDATAPFAIKAFREMSGRRLWCPERVALFIDHAAPAPNEQVGNLHRVMREFAIETGCRFYDAGAGIGHQVMVEKGHVRPGELVVGADSHTCAYGALGAFATGMGATDVAGVFLTGKTWLKVPKTMRIELQGRPPEGISAKDLTLHVVGRLGIEGATYQAVEFGGPAVRALSLSGRMTLASMAVEMGAKAGLIGTKGLALEASYSHVAADPDAEYSIVHRFDISELRPQISLPHSPDNVFSIDEAIGTQIDMAFIGTCTNGRLEDLRAAAAVLRGHKIHPRVRFVVAPASRDTFIEALREGVVRILLEAGATFITPGCGPCVGTHMGVPGDSEVVISSANRNFRGRMGNSKAKIYLASPAIVALAARFGEITDPATKDGEIL